jgi:thioredoxin-dependent peroxiredoxin
MATERQGAASLRGNPFTVIGKELKPGDAAPELNVVGAGNANVSLADSAGKVRIIATVPSLDTPVCSTETKKWEAQRGDLGDITMITVSMDLPPGQARWRNRSSLISTP